MFRIEKNRYRNGTILAMGIVYDRGLDGDQTRGMTQPKEYTYALLKTGGLWYATGSGRVPTAAGVEAVNRWLERDGRRVVWVQRVSALEPVFHVIDDEPVQAQLPS